VLLEDLQTACDQLEAGVPVRLPARTSSYQSWAARLAGYPADKQLDYWTTALQPMALPAADPHGDNLAGRSERIELALSPERTRQLLQQAPTAYRTQVNDLLLAALAQAVCGWSGAPSALIELEGHGREDLFDGIDLSRSVGWFTARYPVSLAAQADPGAAIKAVKERLRAVPDKGIGWGVLEQAGHPAVAALPQARICFNYLGQLDASFGGLFAPAPEEPGSSSSPLARRSHWLNLNALVAQQSLRLGWTYSPAIHDRQQIETLAQAYLAALEALIDHCLTTQGDVTPSDFPDIDIGQDDLDRFLEEIL
jgi:non-ribosomal peptide synthase protein (TIGR01720 family)